MPLLVLVVFPLCVPAFAQFAVEPSKVSERPDMEFGGKQLKRGQVVRFIEDQRTQV